jgi:hypothetical protein
VLLLGLDWLLFSACTCFAQSNEERCWVNFETNAFWLCCTVAGLYSLFYRGAFGVVTFITCTLLLVLPVVHIT